MCSTYGTTRHADPTITTEIARLVRLESGKCFLDLACGTGNYTAALATLGGCWYGIDISEVMLQQAAKKPSDIGWGVASADSLPFQGGFFNGAVCSLAIHHFPELVRPFQEIWRVLDQGYLVIFTAFAEQMQNYWLCHYFPEMMQRSLEKMPSQKVVVEALRSASFEIESITPFYVTRKLQDLFLYSGKDRPWLYLDPGVRSNISSFATLCTADELQKGLCDLQADLDSGRFLNIAQRYSSSCGDYVYVVAKKGG